MNWPISHLYFKRTISFVSPKKKSSHLSLPPYRSFWPLYSAGESTLRASSRDMPRCDMISALPEPLITKILSYLPTKHSVTTSVLSTRWKSLWLSVPSLDINCDDFPYGEEEVVLTFLDRFLEFNPDLRLLKVKVKCGNVEIEGLKERISTVIQRGPQHLDVEGCIYYIDPDAQLYPSVEYMPLDLYTSKTLVSLKLLSSGVEDPGFVCMPCLKSMTLVKSRFRDDVSLEKLVSGCPVLEELTLVRARDSSFEDEVDSFMRVRSGSLKRFRVPRHGYWGNTRGKCTLEIDAPVLEHMTLGEGHYDSVVLKNLTSLFSVDLDIKFGGVKLREFFVPEDSSERKNFGHLFLSGISSVRHMIISEKTVEALHLYSDVGLIPKFNNLSRLEAVFPSKLLQFLPVFLECCPNLKHLILEVVYSTFIGDAFELANVPQCFLSTLECVELKRIHDWEEEEMKVATYFLENAAVLKKLTLSLTNYPRYVSDEEIFEEVNKVTKRSPTCQIFVIGIYADE
ncbi:FBD-associated F-box protein [Raphanus sativus]|uniref:FBD-associated F-box protein At5g27750 n=1 Tax=Raphanus sativus TaxID=3726 RepID=A0A6J0JN93_RAPSA|nr:FBD-associated F-box protein At5g27750 [Raphanus sativus]KAJ4915706.1 FBD-associated F-box protein [Raphanus sativus]